MRHSFVSRLLTVAALAASAIAVSPGPSQAISNPIQPGQSIQTSTGQCTANFVYDGTGAKAGKTYIGTAAHCVSAIGQRVVLSSTGENFGNVAAFGDANDVTKDWALIEILPAFISRVSASVTGHPSYPTGVTTPDMTAVGDLVQMSGYGAVYATTAATRESRLAALTTDNAETAQLLSPVIYGDSGGPLVHVKSGRALGLVSRLCFGLCDEIGPTISGVLAKAAAAGFTVNLRTV